MAEIEFLGSAVFPLSAHLFRNAGDDSSSLRNYWYASLLLYSFGYFREHLHSLYFSLFRRKLIRRLARCCGKMAGDLLLDTTRCVMHDWGIIIFFNKTSLWNHLGGGLIVIVLLILFSCWKLTPAAHSEDSTAEGLTRWNAAKRNGEVETHVECVGH